MRSCVLSSAVAILLLGCASQNDSSAEVSTSNLTQVDQTGIDAQVLQVWTPGRLFPTMNPGGWFGPTDRDVKIDATSCPTSNTQTLGAVELRDVDCASALAQALPFDLTKEPGPVMTPTVFTLTSPANRPPSIDPDYCKYVEVRVVVRDAASSQPSFAGIGFWTSHGDAFVAKSDLQSVGHTRLKNGDDASVYRFTGISTCISSAHNSTSGNAFQTFGFKPYAAFDADGTRTRVWERISGNHWLGRSWPGATPSVNSDGFDRQGDLLAN